MRIENRLLLLRKSIITRKTMSDNHQRVISTLPRISTEEEPTKTVKSPGS